MSFVALRCDDEPLVSILRPIGIDVHFRVNGIPKGQPRPRATIRGRHAGVFDPGTAAEWKGLIALAARPLRPVEPIDRPIRVSIEFYMPRPKRLMLTKDPDGPVWCLAKPDVDNLAKAAVDALTQDGWFVDDALVVELAVAKVYHSKRGIPGARIQITEPSVLV